MITYFNMLFNNFLFFSKSYPLYLILLVSQCPPYHSAWSLPIPPLGQRRMDICICLFTCSLQPFLFYWDEPFKSPKRFHPFFLNQISYAFPFLFSMVWFLCGFFFPVFSFCLSSCRLLVGNGYGWEDICLFQFCLTEFHLL